MADRYAVATGNWNDNNTWAATTGGAAGASFPTSADNAYFDALSGNITVTVNVSSACLKLGLKGVADITAFTGTLAGSSNLDVYASMNVSDSMTFSYAGNITFKATSTGHTLTFNAKAITASGLSFNGVGGGWTFQDAATLYYVNLYAGTLDLNGQTTVLTDDLNADAGSSTRVLTLGAATITVKSWISGAVAGLTLSAASSTITASGTVFTGGSNTFGTVTLTCVTALVMTGAMTFGTLSRTNATGYVSTTLSANITVTGTFTVTGNNASTRRIHVKSDTTGTARTITAAVVALTNVDFEDVTAAGAASPFTGTSIGNCGGNTNITQTTPISCYWVHAGADSRIITDALWFTASGGAVASRFPLPQDTGVFDANSFGAASKTVTTGIANLRLPTINWTGATNSPTFNLDGATPYIHGSLTLISGMTLTTTAQISFVGRGSYTLTSAGKTFGGVVQLRAASGTLTQQDAFVGSSDLYVRAGTWTANNFNVTVASGNLDFRPTGDVASSGLTHAVNMGTGTWTTRDGLDLSGATALVLTCSTSTVAVSTTGTATFNDDVGFTLFNVTVGGSSACTFNMNLGGATSVSGTMTLSNTHASTSINLSTTAQTKVYKHIVFATGFTGTWAYAASGSITVSGNLTLVSTMATLVFAGAIAFTATSSVTITSAGKTFLSAFTFNGSGGTWVFADAFITTGAVTLTNGTLDAATNNVAFTAASFSSSNSNTRAVSMGSGTWTITGTGTWWDIGTSTGMTLTRGTSTIKNTSELVSTKTFKGGGLTYYDIWLYHVTDPGGFNYDFEGDNTFNDFKCDTPGHSIRFKTGSNTSIATWHVDGASGNLTTLAQF